MRDTLDKKMFHSKEDQALYGDDNTLVIVDEIDQVLIDDKLTLHAKFCVGLTATGID